MQPVNLGLFLIERKTDVIAFVAFLISVFNLVVAGWWLFRGPDPHLIPASTVTLSSYQYKDTENAKRYLRLAADMVYANEGPEGQGIILKKETVRISAPDTPGLLDIPVEMVWSKFEERSTQGDRKIRENVKNAYPVTIHGKGVQAHHTFFAPHSVNCNRRSGKKAVKEDCDIAANFVDIDLLAKSMRKKLNGSTCYGKDECIRLELTFISEFFDDNPIETRCSVFLRKSHIDNLQDKNRTLTLASLPVPPEKSSFVQYGWTTRECHPSG